VVITSRSDEAQARLASIAAAVVALDWFLWDLLIILAYIYW
jgi:hypothetical protein